MRPLRLMVLAVALFAAGNALAQVRPATLTKVTPAGARRGTTVTLTVEGTNLAGASAVLFDDEALTGRIVSNEDRGPDVPKRDPESTGPPITDRARKHRLSIEVGLGEKASLGRHSFRMVTPLGATNQASLVVGRLPEAAEKEPNEAPGAQPLALPVTVNGALDKENDVDRYRFEARAGQTLVFETTAARIGSGLDPVLTLRDQSGQVLARGGGVAGRPDPVLGHTFEAAGAYLVEVSDALNGGGERHFYRLSAGELPYVTSVFPLGVRRGARATLALEGYNLDPATVTVDASEAGPDKDKLRVAVGSPRGEALNMVEVALGDHAEAAEREPNARLSAQPLAVPSTVNGRIQAAGGTDEDYYRFRAVKGRPIAFSVLADRLGSRLDSVLEVLDLAGRPVPRATLRPVWQTTVDLRDQESTTMGIRLLAWSGIQTGDYVYMDRELMRVQELPGHPDADATFVGFRGRRQAFEETTPEGHALNAPVYRVEVHRPGASFPPNGMPVFTVHYRNDDGGFTFGKDSRLTFTPPATGDYLLRVSDRRGLAGPDFAYRLTAAEPRPDFRLFLGTPAPNVPRGGRVPVTVAVERRDGFEGPIEVEVRDLPAGLTATPGTVLPADNDVALTLAAAETVEAAPPARFRVVGRATIAGQVVEREAVPDGPPPLSVASVGGPPDLYVAAVEPREIALEAGGRAKVKVRIKRANGFAGRVPVGVQNLPLGVHIPDIGLNGVLITEQQEEREFYLQADPHAPAQEQRLFLTGRVETNSSLPTEQASEAILLRIVPKRTAASP